LFKAEGPGEEGTRAQGGGRGHHFPQDDRERSGIQQGHFGLQRKHRNRRRQAI